MGLSAEGLGFSTYKLSPAKAFLGQVPAEHGSLARDHMQSTKPIPTFWELFLFFKRRRPSWLLVLSLYNDSPAFLACTFLFQSALHLQLFLLLSLNRVWYTACSLPHTPSWYKGSSVAVPPGSPELFRSWLFHQSPGPGTSWTLASLTTDRTWAASAPLLR